MSLWCIEWWNSRPNMGWPGDHTPAWVRWPASMPVLLTQYTLEQAMREAREQQVKQRAFPWRIRNLDTDEVIMAAVL